MKGSFDIVNVLGKGVLPQKVFGLNGVKSCNFRQENMEMSFHNF